MLFFMITFFVTKSCIADNDEDDDNSCASTSYYRGDEVNDWNFNKNSIPERIQNWIASINIESWDEPLKQSKHFGQKQLCWQGVNKAQRKKDLNVNGFLYGALNSKECFQKSLRIV